MSIYIYTHTYTHLHTHAYTTHHVFAGSQMKCCCGILSVSDASSGLSTAGLIIPTMLHNARGMDITCVYINLCTYLCAYTYVFMYVMWTYHM